MTASTTAASVCQRALISVSDKTGLVDFAAALVARGFDLVSTGGTARALQDAGLQVSTVESLTGFPEILDGRVKTLHPVIHGGLLANLHRPDHRATLAAHGIEGFGLAVLNLYPFAQTLEAKAAFEACLEQIDIGGPAMLRAAAKNHAHVLPLIDADQFDATLAALDAGDLDPLRQAYAARAFDHTSKYDRLVADFLAGGGMESLRYGENPHQRGELILPTAKGLNCAAHGVQVQGKALSYNNFLDADAAWELCQDLGGTNAVIVKHTNPCGAAYGNTIGEAFDGAQACDPVSAFGGVIALSAPLDQATAARIRDLFVEVILAPEIGAAARQVFADKPQVRLLEVANTQRPSRPWAYRSLSGAMVRQSFDRHQVQASDLTTPTAKAPNAAQVQDLLFAFTVAKHTKSNAIVLAHQGRTLGIGAGQMSRVDAARMARWKAEAAGLDTRGCVVASDAFFPFADGLQVAIDAGASAVIQPGGSQRDAQVIAAADAARLAMVFTGIRHFRH